MKELKVELASRSYKIKIGQDVLQDLGQELQSVGFKGKLLIVTDENVSPLYADSCLESLEKSGFQTRVFSIPPGEESKSWMWAEQIFSAVLDFNLDRDSGIVALGGGVVGDLAGFIAATYLRGVAYVQVPTTLLAQVDSSVGGKVAINHSRGKNMIGAFYQPRLVLIDLNTLDTLPFRELRSGMAEVIKYGVIRDDIFFKELYRNLVTTLEQEKEFLEYIVFKSCLIKADVVSVDEQEGGVRAILNFGHTLGHALEAATDYKYFNHGEALHYGMLLASRLACREGLLDLKSLNLIEDLLCRIGFKGLPPVLDADKIKKGLTYDKKRKEGKMIFILPERIGRVGIYDSISQEKVDKLLLDFFKEFY